MIEMKYVVVHSESTGEQMFIFPKAVDHDAFVEVVSHIKVGDGHYWNRPFRQVVSAGFTDGANCYGRSETLNIGSRGQDMVLLAQGGASRNAGFL